MSIVGAALGIGAAAFIYTRFLGRLGSPIPLFEHSFFIDEIYDKLLVSPLKKLAQWIAGRAEPRYFEGSIEAVGVVTWKGARLLQYLQSGQVRSYAAYMMLGAVFLLTYLLNVGK